VATLPLWAIGKHITAFTLTPQSQNTSTGVLSDTTPVATMYGHMQECEVESRNTLENISAMDRPVENNVIIERGTVYRITELEKSAGTNLLAQAGYGADVFKLVLTRGAQSWTGYAVAGNYRMSAVKARVTGTFQLEPVDIGAANPVYG